LKLVGILYFGQVLVMENMYSQNVDYIIISINIAKIKSIVVVRRVHQKPAIKDVEKQIITRHLLIIV